MLSKMKNILIVVFLLNALLVSTHKGEFWPFSIFPMFSQAGNPWSRGIVFEVDDINRADLWKTQPLSNIDDKVVSLSEHGVDDIDYANFISKTKVWDDERVLALRNLFQIEQKKDAQWLTCRVTGYLTEEDSVVVNVVPMFLITSDTTYKNPDLFK